MHFPFYISKRYLLSKKSHNIINIISGISVLGVCIGTLALIVVLSVFNGFEDLVKSMYSAFDPDLNITAALGKSFDVTQVSREEIMKIPGVISYTEVVEESALIKNKNEQYIVRLKGVSDDFLKQNPLDTMLVDGQMIFEGDGHDYTVMGYLVAYRLGIKIFDFDKPLTVFVPRRTKKVLTRFDQSFNSGRLIPSAVFSVQQEIDSKYLLVSANFARKLLEYSPTDVTSIEIRTETNAPVENIKEQVQAIIGSDFIIKNRYQQQELLYKIMKSEKWAIFLILTFILIIAVFNVVGSLSLLILDKRKDIAVLHSMGAGKRTIKRIFLTEGLLISLSGAIAGLILGYLICLAQIKFGIIRLGEANAFVVPFYPVKMEFPDFVYVFLTVIAIGWAAAWFPVRQISSKYLKDRFLEFTK